MSISVQNLTKIYGSQKAVDAISFEVGKGDIVGFLGPNGAGKSTTMKILTCFIPQTAGKALVNGFDTMEESEKVRAGIGYLPEMNPLYPDMYVKEYLLFAAGIHDLKNKAADEAAERAISLTGLTPERKKLIGQLSKGYRQRVGLAQAILHNPQVLILDEPTSGLDPNQLIEIRQLIKDLGKDRTVLLSTHIMSEVEAMCSRVVIINRGHIAADDRLENLTGQAKSRTLISLTLKNEAAIGDLRSIKGVKNVMQNGVKSYQLEAASDANIQESIYQTAVQKGWVILELRQEDTSLEQIFRQLTQTNAS